MISASKRSHRSKAKGALRLSALPWVALGVGWLAISSAMSAEAPVRVTLLVDTDPAFAAPPEITTVSPKLADLWLTALARDEFDLKLEAARALVEAHRLGLPSSEKMVAALRRELVAEGQPLAVRLQVAQALAALDAKSAAADLLAQSQARGLDMQLVVEPALASWKYEPAYEVWRKRIADPAARRRALGLAIAALVEIQDRSSAAKLAAIAADPLRPSDVRLAAARAAGEIQRAGFEPQARELMSARAPAAMIARLCAANLLRHHAGAAAQPLLVELADDPQPAVAAIALERLLAIDPALAAPLNERIAAHRDTKIRLLAVALFDGQATPATVGLLGPMLDDVHPGVRGGAREALIRLDGIDTLSEHVRSAATSVLQGDKVRGLEQAAIVLGAIDHEPAAPRLVALLEHAEPRVFITAAWGLRKLAVPDTAAPILAKLHRETDKSVALQQQIEEMYKRKEPLPDLSPWQPVYAQLAHLAEALGVLGHREALPELKRYFPKPPMVAVTDPPPVATTRQYPLRAAVIGALGWMFRGEQPAELVDYLTERLSDENPTHAESTQVRATAAVALARMEAKEQVPTLEKFFTPGDGYSSLTAACGWALERMAGREPYRPQPLEARKFGWFLEPLDQ